MIYFTNKKGDEIELKTLRIVCPRCLGKGTHVNPNIDSDGIPDPVFKNDHEFAETYFGGMYDIICSKCKGERTIEIPDISKNTSKDLMEYHTYKAEIRSMERTCAAELRMGA